MNFNDEKDDFDENAALAELLTYDVLILNSYWYEHHWTEAERKRIAIGVNLNDIFCYGADAIELDYEDLKSLYDHWKHDVYCGVAVWAAKKTNMRPLKRIYDVIEEEGKWNMEDLKHLKYNPCDAPIAHS